MDKDFAPLPHRIQRCVATLGASSNPSRIPGLSARSLGTGGLAAVSPILKKEACLNSFRQDPTKQIPLAKGRVIPRPNSRVGPPKPPRSHEQPSSCSPLMTSQSLQWTAANGLEPRKLSAISFTLHRSSDAPPAGRQLLLHSMAKRNFQKVPLQKEALGRGGEVPLPSPLPPSGLQILPQRVAESSADMETTPCQEDENYSSDAMPDFQRHLLCDSPPLTPSQPSPQNIGEDPMNSALKETVQEGLASNDQYGIPKDIDPPKGLAESGQLLPTFPQEHLEGHALMGNCFMADSTMSPVTNTTRFKWPADTKPEAAMSELVPEPRQKPVVPMKPIGINSNLLGYIGIDTIIEQMRKKTMKTGFDFNIMVVGQSGLGKSTLVNTLFKSQVSRKSSGWNREEKIPKTVEIKAIGHVIEEGGVKMKLTVIDTPGFGDQINNENCWEPIEKYINEQYEKFLKEEVNIARKKRIPDTRVHCCLYFISPTGHSLRPLDMEFMKHLSKVVNIIPVIAKADTMTLEEKIEFKQRVRKELEINGIEFYPQKEFDEDLEDKTENDKIRESMPFAVVGSDKEYQVNGKRVLGRKTPWGVIEVENLNHCEFALLRDFVIRTHLQDLKEVTHNIHYETYRAKRLNDNGGLPPVTVETEENHESNL
ncbi:neuronal-specific septin-3 isoform X2 [Rhineura floridana]|uniref:neuronal-specific septin-3 isoform X2 n=1 Tax=Rhineura floridana TaxID=261503 RepID=UPI002AC8287E|nr:neuronal-specific septin-3 isoform X2 [Rhineura floridana]